MHTVVAERSDALLGFYRLAGETLVAELADLFVDPTVTGRGVGATLLADAVGFSVRVGARRVGSVVSCVIVRKELPGFELVVDPAGG